jgi:hydroxymethylbilane synthase
MNLLRSLSGPIGRNLARGWASLLRGAGHLVFPWTCLGCGDQSGALLGPLCEPCRGRLLDGAGARVCLRCALPVGPHPHLAGGCSWCRRRPLGYDAALALGPYEGLLRALCLLLKHEQNAWLARRLADLLAEARGDELAGLPRDAWIVPVPLHWRRRWQRGYNQAEALARRLSERLDLRLCQPLRRVKPTDHLAGRKAVERHRDMRDAFRARAASGLKGRTILLVDDILTTGATSGAAARALKRAGARRVVVAVLARTIRPRPPETHGQPARKNLLSTEHAEPPSRSDTIPLDPSTQGPLPTMTGATTSPSRRLKIATRGSRLARWQADWVADRLRALHPELAVELIEIRTQGDRDRNTPLSAIGGTGLFTKEIQRALLDGLADVAVHSLKDLPTQGPPELILAAVPIREEVADALIAPSHGTLASLPRGARVGTSSLRRRAQLLHLRPDLRVETIRGNVETRLNRALEGKLEAVVLAWAGLHRLGLERHVTERLGPPTFLPAVGQGALGIECRSEDAFACSLLAPLDDPPSHRAVVAERAALAELEGGCIIPMGAWARDVDGEGGALALDAAVLDPDGRERVAASAVGPRDDPAALGRQVARTLRDRGAEPLLRRVRESSA